MPVGPLTDRLPNCPISTVEAAASRLDRDTAGDVGGHADIDAVQRAKRRIKLLERQHLLPVGGRVGNRLLLQNGLFAAHVTQTFRIRTVFSFRGARQELADAERADRYLATIKPPCNYSDDELGSNRSSPVVAQPATVGRLRLPPDPHQRACVRWAKRRWVATSSSRETAQANCTIGTTCMRVTVFAAARRKPGGGTFWSREM